MRRRVLRTRPARLWGALAGLFALAVPATAAEAEPETADEGRLEEVVVIGSRARIEVEAHELPVPVDLYPDTDLERVGEVDLAAALTKLAPSLNYSRTSVGDGGSFNPATLRGLSPDQTLVLVNGKRRHGMAWVRVLDGVIGWGSGGTDLRAIPSAALARVEVLRDGAAAQYGSDAIAGVINLVLRENTGGQITAYLTGAGDGGGERINLSFNGGVSLGAGGFLNVTGEWHDEEA
ncbi:MAG: TonB-dependent receptor plug domain-containing protein, partial [Gammaproteobacteria bacterium]|nr:TonB-dependent receptor plug domain-containing protein [Gammaproteobacteria bacterium]